MKLGEILQIEKNNKINIDDNETYVIAGMQSYGKGVINKRKERGKDLKMKKYQVIKENQLMWCKVDTKNGAFGITRLEHKGSLASNNMALANINLKKINPEFLQLLFTIPSFYNYINGFCTGTTNRKYLKPKEVLELIEIPDLNLKEQNLILEKYKKVKKLYENLEKEITNQGDYIDKLKASILGLALKGKLVPQDEDDEPASVLLERIKKEKEQRIKDKKIKKEKTIPEIREDEIPYELPNSWEWVRLLETAENCKVPFADGPFGSDLKSIHYTDKQEVRIIQLSNIGEKEWKNNNVRYTTFEHLETIKRSMVKCGDLVIAKMKPAGRAIEIPNIEKAYVLSSDAVKFVPHHSLEKRYLLYAINSDIFRKQINAEVQGITRMRTSLTKLKGYLIPLPPRNEQKRIVEKIDSLMTLCDELEKEINNSKQISENLMIKLLDEELSK